LNLSSVYLASIFAFKFTLYHYNLRAVAALVEIPAMDEGGMEGAVGGGAQSMAGFSAELQKLITAVGVVTSTYVCHCHLHLRLGLLLPPPLPPRVITPTPRGCHIGYMDT
jgi:hypothetical protein